MSSASEMPQGLPDSRVSIRDAFGIDSDATCLAYRHSSDHVPAIDPGHRFDPEVTLAIIAGFEKNRRVLVQGLHGSGKSTHIEQVAARLNWPCVRLNFDGHVSRMDLIGKDVVSVRDGHQVIEFREGIVPWAFQRPVALVFDEYDAGRPDLLFVLQRVLESQGRLTLLDQNRVLRPHAAFRIFATANTVGLGDATGLYHGTHPINQGHIDRFQIFPTLNYLPALAEQEMVRARVPGLDQVDPALIGRMVELAGLIRTAFSAGKLSTVMSLRTLVTWGENIEIFSGIDSAFRLSFLNRCDEAERGTIAELYQRCFGVDPLGELF